MNEESWDQISGGKGPFPYLGYTHLYESVTVKLTENQPEISPFFFCRSELSDLISSSLSCNNDAVLTKSNERQKPRLQVKANKCRTCVCVCVWHTCFAAAGGLRGSSSGCPSVWWEKREPPAPPSAAAPSHWTCRAELSHICTSQ